MWLNFGGIATIWRGLCHPPSVEPPPRRKSWPCVSTSAIARIQGVAASVSLLVCVLLPWRGYSQEQTRYPSHSTSSSSPVQRMIKVCRQQLSPIPRVCYCDVSLHWPRHRLTETGPVLTGWMNGHFPLHISPSNIRLSSFGHRGHFCPPRHGARRLFLRIMPPGPECCIT